jgi:hypothetical protein
MFRIAGLVFLAAVCAAETVTFHPVADTWIAVPEFGRFRSPEAMRGGRGAAPEMIIKGREAMSLLRFDLGLLKGRTVARAVLRLHRAADPVPLHTLGLSTVSGAGPWTEDGAAFGTAREGAPWSFPGSDVTDVTFGPGGSLYAYSRARDAGEGWWETDVPPAIVHAMATGDQFGLLVGDEKGQTQTRHVLSSRESANPPILIVETSSPGPVAAGRARAIPIASTPEAARTLGRTTLAPGGVILKFAAAERAVRHEIRYSEKPIDAASFEAATPVPRWMVDPLAPKSNPLATSNALGDTAVTVVEGLGPGREYYFAVRAADAAGNAGPVASLGRYRAYSREFPTLPPQVSSVPAAGADRPRIWAAPELWKIDPRTGDALEGAAGYRGANPVWDAQLGVVRLQGARNEFIGFQVAVEGPQAGVTVALDQPLFARSKLPPVLQKTGAVQIYREWFVPDERGAAESRRWYADALIPLEGDFDVPSPDNAVPGQRVQPLFVDVFIPHDAAAGKHSGRLVVTSGSTRREIALDVDVLPFTLPDKLSFIVDLNCYSGVPSGPEAPRGSPAYRAVEIDYHRVAHLHRTNLDILGYHHDGSTVPDHAPPLAGEGAATRVASWADWDAHFGPILDGSAFSDLPRGATPVPAIYLPFFENWPGDLRKHYRFNDYPVAKTEEEFRDIVSRHALAAAPVEQSFSKEYQERFTAVAADFARHIRERGWMNTEYLVYFNNKYYYKRPSQGGRGVSWWLMDEPNHRDDIRAASFLATLLRRGLEKYPEVPIRYRTDISRVEWIRDLYAGQIDLNCISPHFYDKNRSLLTDRRRFGKHYWNYASTNHPRETNVFLRAWAWRVWLNGGDGLLPWNAVRGAQAWDRAEPLTVFYPGSKFGRREPFASLRLKAYRRGQQDVEYLALLASQSGWDRDAVTRAVLGDLNLSADVVRTSDEDAGTQRFRSVRDEQLEAMRQRVAAAIVSGRR